jgi:hypothetical protein
MKAKILKPIKTGKESQVAMGEVLPFEGGGQTSSGRPIDRFRSEKSSGPTEKHDSPKAGKDGQPCQQREPKRVLASE